MLRLWTAWIVVPSLVVHESCRAPTAAGLLPRRLPRGARAPHTAVRQVLVPSADRKLKHSLKRCAHAGMQKERKGPAKYIPSRFGAGRGSVSFVYFIWTHRTPVFFQRHELPSAVHNFEGVKVLLFAFRETEQCYKNGER